jgi:ElaA protein
MKFEIKEFHQLSTNELYSILKIRQEVFIIEQNCNYLDCDGLDLKAIHMSLKIGGELMAYLRMIKPNVLSENIVLGRILVSINERDKNIGKEMMLQAINFLEEQYPNLSIEMSAQSYLIDFYNQFGFNIIGEEYLEDNIPHIKMIKKR